MLEIRIIHAVHVVLDLRIVKVCLLQKIYKCPAGFGSFFLVCEDLLFGKTYKTAVFFRQVIRVIVFGISPLIRRQEMSERNYRKQRPVVALKIGTSEE